MANKLNRLVKIIKSRLPAKAGKENAMGDNPASATPPASSGGLSEEKLNGMIESAVKTALGGVVKQVQDLVSPIAESVKTLKSDHEKLAGTLGNVTKPEDLAKLVAGEVSRQQQESAAAATSKAAKAELRKKVVAARLPGVPESLIQLPDTDDEKALSDAADKLRGEIEKMPGVKLADVGGVSKDGGTTPANPAQPPKYTSSNSDLSAGAAKFASGLKLPGNR